MIESFPLCWPEGWARAESRKSSPYKVTAESALTELVADLRLMNATGVVISSNVAVRRDGTMYRDQAADPIRDPGVAVYWETDDGEPMVLACDVWLTPRENVRAIGLTVAAFRMIDRAGVSDLLRRVFTGFKRLPAPDDSWWRVLGVDRDASKEAIAARHRELAREHHPDRGGDAATMARVNAARDEALKLRAS